MVFIHDRYSHQCLRAWRICAALVFCLLVFPVSVNAAKVNQQEPVTDLRILVDVSGSMKNNDPKNLRRDALRLLIGLLPETSRAGIWSFGQYVNMQVKPGFATPAWKNKARKEANTIHSRGLYTNIEDTLTKSSWDWKRPDPKWDRHMILLTDGMVDISKDPKKDAQSRQNILGKIVSDLRAANVKIHTIALSQQADHELLQKLSKKTGGWYEAVDSAEKLQRLFLRLFEKTTTMDSLPLEDNLFDVDDSISDMTLLVFRSNNNKKTRVLLPDHSVLEYGKSVSNVEWFKDNSFDIITVKNPMPGKWKLDADINKDNRVKIVSNLKLRVSDLPVDIIANESVMLKASILTKDGLLKDKALLDLIKVSSQSVGYKGIETNQTLAASNTAGQYEALLEGVDEKGTVQITVKAISPTFKRESRHEIKVHENPVKLSVSATTRGLIIDVKEDPAIIQTGTLQLALRIDGNKGAYYITKAGAHHWQAVLDNRFAGRGITVDATANRIGNIVYRSTLHGRLPEAIKPPPDPLTVWAEETDAGMVVKALLEGDVLQTGTLQLAYSVEGEKDKKTIVTQQNDKVWQIALPESDTGKTLIVTATAYLLDGEAFKKDYPVAVPEPDRQTVEHKEPEHEKEQVEHGDDAAEDKHEVENDVVAEDTDGPNMIIVISALVIVNLIIFGGAYMGYRYWRKKNKPLEDLEEPDKEVNEASTEADDNENGQESVPRVEPDVEQPADLEAAPEENETDEEDYTEQRKTPETPKDVELDVEEPDTDEDIPELIDTASADDLPEFDVDVESDLTEENKQEKDDG